MIGHKVTDCSSLLVITCKLSIDALQRCTLQHLYSGHAAQQAVEAEQSGKPCKSATEEVQLEGCSCCIHSKSYTVNTQKAWTFERRLGTPECHLKVYNVVRAATSRLQPQERSEQTMLISPQGEGRLAGHDQNKQTSIYEKQRLRQAAPEPAGGLSLVGILCLMMLATV